MEIKLDTIEESQKIRDEIHEMMEVIKNDDLKMELSYDALHATALYYTIAKMRQEISSLKQEIEEMKKSLLS
jgi:cell division protein FtsB